MTAFNRELYIAEAIESVLASTYGDLELIIVDDCSTDNSVAIAREYEKKDKRVHVYENEENLGDYPNRNKAASLASGRYIKYLDSDDLIYPHGLQVMVAAMNQFPEAGFGLSAIGDPGQPYPALLTPVESYLEHFYGYGHFDRAPGSSIISRAAFNAVNGFSGKRMIGDNELWFKMAARYPLVKFQRDLVWDRIHPGQESKSTYARQYDILRKEVIEEALNSDYCPLPASEIAQIRRTIFKKKITGALKKLKPGF
jgi:glycosyltransferase involved in cell wall biosynthesis